MRINRIISKTRAEGPGVRFCIWAQGCGHHCEGCFARETWDPAGGYEISPDELIGKIHAVKDAIDGITLLGGEPFDQAGELEPVASYAHAIGKSVIAFSGYTYEALRSAGCRNLLAHVDLLIDGEYDRHLPEKARPLAGSTNQRFLYLSDRIPKASMDGYRNRFEVRIGQGGEILINGMGDLDKMKAVLMA